MSSCTFEDWCRKSESLQIEGRSYIGGRHVSANDQRVFDCISAVDGQIRGQIARCSAPDVDAAVAAARHAFVDSGWATLDPASRKTILLDWVSLIQENAADIALLESVEVGKPINDTLNVDVPGCIAALAYYAEYADKLFLSIAPTGPQDQAILKRTPLGVVGAIVPWNYPLIIAAWKLGPALVLDNAVVLKPAEQSSLGSIRLAELASKAGLPDGVVNVVTGLSNEAGEALASHMDVDAVAFTGSTETGRKVMEAAAQSNLKRVSLELGGKSPQVVLADCLDLDRAASAIAWSIFYNAGQTCHAGSRLIVERSIAHRLYRKIETVAKAIKIGHPLDPSTQLGALSSDGQLVRVAEYLDLIGTDGAQIIFGGNRVHPIANGAYVEPTLVALSEPSSRLAHEEIFGPVLVALEVDSPEEALAVANDTHFGLAASIWTGNIREAHRFGERLNAGTVWVNTYDQSSMSTPFGGFKQSGFGRDRSYHALDKYRDTKTIWSHYG